VKKEQLTLEGIRQFYLAINQEELKYKTLVELYKNLTVSQSIVFCNSKRTVDELTEKLKADMFTVSKIHSHMEQSERE
jgi:translation initiation factor 4A